MSRRLSQYAVAVAVAAFSLSSSAIAQSTEKAAPRTLPVTTSSEAAKTALATAVREAENLGGAHRVDPALKAVLDADAQLALGRAYYARFASGMTAAQRASEYERALKDAASASTAELAFIAGMRENTGGRNAVARDFFDLAIKLAPDDPRVTYYRTLVSANAAEGLKLSQAAAEKFPDFAPNWNTLAYRLNTAGNKAEAIAAVQKYVSLEPKLPNPHDSYAEILSLQGQLDESDTHYKHVLQIDPRFEVAHEGMAENAVKRGDFATARAHLNEALKVDVAPGRRITLMNDIAATFAMENKGKEARAQYMAIIESAQSAALPARAQEAHRMIGMMDAIAGRAKEATQHYTAGAPTNPGPFVPLADAIFHGTLGHADAVSAAIVAMEKNAAAAPDDVARREAVHLAQLIHAVHTKDLAAAREHQRALKLSGLRAVAGGFLAKPLARARDQAGAKAAMDDVMAHATLDGNAAIARLMAKR